MFLLALLACHENRLTAFAGPPVAKITSPADGAQFPEGQTVAFLGNVEDTHGDERPALAVDWSTDVGILDSTPPDGLGNVGFATGTLPAGLHTVTLRVTDTDGLYANAAVTVAVLGGGDTGDASDTGPIDPGAPNQDTGGDTATETAGDTAPDTAPSDGLVTITWTTPGGQEATRLVASGSGAANWDEAARTWSDTVLGSGPSITFQVAVPPGGALRYSVEATIDGRASWSCESRSADETDDALTGTHRLSYAAPDGSTCTLTPSVYSKTSGVVDGCEATVFAVSCG